jgi:N-hydroxyarylamine O-acetyltransferase
MYDPGMNLEAYFKRIGWTGGTKADLQTLSGILLAHMTHIPFENLDILLGRPVHLEIEPLHEKLVTRKRGGYCFEHSTLLGAVLDKIGFQVKRHTARVTAHAAPTEAPRTHMILSVTLPEGKFIVDPGFGGVGPRVPVPLKKGAEKTVLDEKHWLTREDRVWALNFQSPEKTVRGWITPLDDDNLIDFELGNHFTSTHPKSVFRKMLMVAIRTAEGRVSLVNNEATIYQNGVAKKMAIESSKILCEFIHEHMGIDLPEAEQLNVHIL